MCLFNLIKTLRLKTKVKTIFNPFFNKQIKKENTIEYIDHLPDKIVEIYNEIRNLEKFKEYKNKYEEYDSYLKEHNNNLDIIYNKAQSFSLKQIINNPTIINYNKVIDDNEDTYHNLFNFKTLDKILKKYKQEYEEFKDFYQIILEQFNKIGILFSIERNLEDIYLDNNYIVEIENTIDTIKNYFSSQTKIYYEPKYPNAKDIINNHNIKFINNHISDSIFDNVNGKSLDYEQRKSILYNPKSNLTIAGAGSGKTLTICGKVKYLIEKLNIPKDQILLLSYSSKSAHDLEEKVKGIASGMNVRTFHSLGLEILNKDTGKKNTIDDSFNAVIEKYFREDLNKNPIMMKKILEYYGLFLSNDEFEEKYNCKGDLYKHLKECDFKTLKNQLEELNESRNKIVTIKKELVKSFEELAIANYLFINGIEYEYETSYKEEDTATIDHRQYTPDFYLPKYGIYYEHFGLDENGRATQYKEEEETKYIDGVNWKKEVHERNHTICIETFSYEFKNGSIFDNLKKRLEENGVEFNPLNDEEIYKAINSIYQGQSFKSFINLVRTFISLYKARYADESEFKELKKIAFANSYEQRRAFLFIDICLDIYRYYIEHLKKENKIDFDDMILKSINALDRTNQYCYKYIIVDEFQDISYSRMNFLKTLIKRGNSKLYAVGDDWQAIYRFSGCDINIFLNFNQYFEDSIYCFITSTHRNSQELQCIAEPFITKNPEQYKKNVKSNKHLVNPIKIMLYDDNKYQSFIKILADINSKDKNANVLLLGRNNRDIEAIESNMFYRESRLSDKYISRDFPDLNIKYITAHASKGLEEDYVVIINADDGKLGFPNQIEDDCILNIVLSKREKFLFAEERRLWYVAMTRTRLYTYILASVKYPSVFVEEILDKVFIMNKNDIKVDSNPIYCPNCKKGRLVLRENKSDNKKFYGCSNYPYCTYTNNDIKQVNINHRCKRCGDFMTYRKGSHGSFWGCKNFPKCTYTEDYIPNNKNYD